MDYHNYKKPGRSGSPPRMNTTKKNNNKRHNNINNTNNNNSKYNMTKCKRGATAFCGRFGNTLKSGSTYFTKNKLNSAIKSVKNYFKSNENKRREKAIENYNLQMKYLQQKSEQYIKNKQHQEGYNIPPIQTTQNNKYKQAIVKEPEVREVEVIYDSIVTPYDVYISNEFDSSVKNKKALNQLYDVSLQSKNKLIQLQNKILVELLNFTPEGNLKTRLRNINKQINLKLNEIDQKIYEE
jgi:hypothetical protein